MLENNAVQRGPAQGVNYIVVPERLHCNPNPLFCAVYEGQGISDRI